MCVISLLSVTVYCYNKKNSNNKEKFNSEHGNKTLIFFKANWCGHCKRFKPVWDEFVEECRTQNEPTKLLELDIDNEESKPLMEKHNVRGFPHVVLTEDDHEDIVFTKNRTKDDLLNFLKEHI
jgi:thiol-disulfide isomerase/thioredoxin